MSSTEIIVAYGDGIGPEIMEAVLFILKEARAKITVRTIELGQKLYAKNFTSGIDQSGWQLLQDAKVLLKSPITTPQSGGYKSLNVTLRKALGLYANVRPATSFAPFVKTHHPQMDVVIIRENEEDIYAGIEYRHTHNVYESVKLISATGSQKIIRYAFEYAKQNGRRKVTCFVKDNIMKFSDGIFHQEFKKIAAQYSDIAAQTMLMDIGTAKLAVKPELFDVIVTLNLYGDIISDVAAEISGSVGLAGSSNIGSACAMFEAVHGSAPDISGKGIANPSGLLNAAVMMLVHINQQEVANLIENAWKKTLEDGIHTADIYNEHTSKKQVSTMEFAQHVVARLGQKPDSLKPANYILSNNFAPFSFSIDNSQIKKLIGADIFIDLVISDPSQLAEKIQQLNLGKWQLQTISAKGLKVWPNNGTCQLLNDHWCCRFLGDDITHQDSAWLLNALSQIGLNFIKLEHLYSFDGQNGFSLAQGE